MNAPVFPMMGFSRHRLGVDGQGVTTLVAAQGCPLRCLYCLNPQGLDESTPVHRVSPEELYAMARVDDLYFQATNGGVTFGGGEPLMHAEFIYAFRKLCGRRWHIMAETCLNVPAEKLEIALECVDEFMVDIKDTDPGIYRLYTGQDNAQVLENLSKLLRAAGNERVTVRVPLIPGFNTEEDVARSVRALRAMGVVKLDLFTYRVN